MTEFDQTNTNILNMWDKFVDGEEIEPRVQTLSSEIKLAGRTNFLNSIEDKSQSKYLGILYC